MALPMVSHGSDDGATSSVEGPFVSRNKCTKEP